MSRLGQPSTTLSGGEAQRDQAGNRTVSKRSTGKTIYILDEPTTGLHFADVHKLMEILQRLCRWWKYGGCYRTQSGCYQDCGLYH